MFHQDEVIMTKLSEKFPVIFHKTFQNINHSKTSHSFLQVSDEYQILSNITPIMKFTLIG